MLCTLELNVGLLLRLWKAAIHTTIMPIKYTTVNLEKAGQFSSV